MFGAHQYGNEAGRLFDQIVQPFQFARSTEVLSLHGLCTAKHPGGRDIVEIGDANRMLEDVAENAIAVIERDMRGAPHVQFHAAFGSGDGVGNIGDLVRLAGSQHLFERAL